MRIEVQVTVKHGSHVLVVGQMLDGQQLSSRQIGYSDSSGSLCRDQLRAGRGDIEIKSMLSQLGNRMGKEHVYLWTIRVHGLGLNDASLHVESDWNGSSRCC